MLEAVRHVALQLEQRRWVFCIQNESYTLPYCKNFKKEQPPIIMHLASVHEDLMGYTKKTVTALTTRIVVVCATIGLQGCRDNGMPIRSNQTSTDASSPGRASSSPAAKSILPARHEREAAGLLEQRGAEIEWNAAGHVSTLNLYWTDLQNEELAQLTIFHQLETLLLPSQTTDVGLAELRNLPQIKILFPPNGITDAGLESIQHLKHLQELHLYGSTQITDAGLQHLRSLQQLEYIGLQHTALTGAGIIHLQKLPSLRWLSLAYTKTSDAELEYLRSMHQLRGLSLFGANLTAEGVDRLQQALPDCVVMH